MLIIERKKRLGYNKVQWLEFTLLPKILWLWHPCEGAFVILLIKYLSPWAGLAFFYGWLCYEIQEFGEIHDTCAKDIRDFLIGLGVTAGIELANKLLIGG